MALFAHQLQPWEENQSPSPVDEIDNPYDLTLSRSTSPQRSNKPSSPISTTNNLHRRLSSAQQSTPESPPPAWNRRNSTSSKGNRSPIGTSPLPQPPVDQAPINAAPPSRRHPNLSMTTTRPLIPGQTLTEDSPSGSMTSFEDPTLPLPQAPFRRRPGSTSNRSSFPGLDLSTLTSEELWTLEQEGVLPDMSNPTRHAAERPLDTVRRISMRMEHSQFFHNGLPGDVIWPSAPPPEDMFAPPVKSKSVNNIAYLTGNPTKRMSRRRTSRQTSLEIPPSAMPPMPGKTVDHMTPYMTAKSMPTSPIGNPPRKDILISSTHSSTTSLASQNITPNKSTPALGNRPPSAYYSRDFLTSLAPREGGYAVAAQMSIPLASTPVNIDERRRSAVTEDMRSRASSRAPMAKSAGMGRWSLDGGEHYGARPYGTPSASTTASNLSAPPINSPDPSPPADDHSSHGSFLPDGAFLPQQQPLENAVPVPDASSTSVLSNRDPSTEPSMRSSVSVPAAPALTSKKSQKMLAKEAKAAEKAAEKLEAQKVARQRAETAREATMEKQAHRDAEAKAKEETKSKEKEEKAKMKADKAKSKLKSSSNLTLPLSLKKAKPTEAPPVPPIPAVLPDPSSPASSFPVTPSQRSDLQDMASDSPSDSRQRRASMPMNALSGSSQKQSQSRLAEQRTPSRSKIGMLGTIKKRLSVFGNDSRSSETPSPASVSPVRSTLVPHAPPSPLPSRDDEPVVVIDSREHSTSNAYGEQVGVWAAVSGNNPESNGDVTATEVPSTMTPMQAESSVSQLPAIQPGDSLSSTPLRSSSRTPPLSSVPFVGAGLAPALSHASPGAFIQPQHHETPPPVPDETDIYSSPTFPRASSHQSGSSGPVIGPVLSKTVSHEYQPTSDSPVSPSRLRSPSIRGPHVSPSAPRSRPTSITTSPSEAQSAVMPSRYPLSSRSDVASPATSGESSLFSYGNRGADHMSPFTSEGSRNSSMTSQAFDSKQMIHGERGIPPPGREDSRNSNETIHADLIGAATDF